MAKIIVVAWFTFILGVMSIAPIAMTITWIKGFLKENKEIDLGRIIFIILVIGFNIIYTYFMVFGVAIQFIIPIFPWLERLAFSLMM